jgi:hypothetical protein
MIDYGTIRIYLHNGLDYDQMYSIVKQNVLNQVITTNRQHMLSIIYQCTRLVSVSSDVSFKGTWEDSCYKFELIVEYFE